MKTIKTKMYYTFSSFPLNLNKLFNGYHDFKISGLCCWIKGVFLWISDQEAPRSNLAGFERQETKDQLDVAWFISGFS